MLKHQLLAAVDIILKDALLTTAGVFQTTANAVDMSKCDKVVALLILTGTGSVTPAAVTLMQGATAAGCSTPLAFDTVFTKLDIGTSQAWVKTAVTANTFNAGVASKTAVYAVEIRASMLTDGMYFARMDVASISTLTGAALIYLPWDFRFGPQTDAAVTV
jgi:hypothetical protein